MASCGVQNRGSCGRAHIDDVLACIDAQASQLPPEKAHVAEAAGRVLAEDIHAPVDLPPFDRAAIDGFAVRADETVGAGPYSPLPIRFAPASAAVTAGRAVRLHAGERLTEGADAVVALDHVVTETEAAGAVIEATVPGAGVERAGCHVVRGNRLAPAGRRLRPADIGLLAAAGVGQVPVVRRPRVRCLLSGRNVVQAGAQLPAGHVHDANGPMLGGLIARDGGVLVEQRWVDRTVAGIREALDSAGADIVLVAGGSGLGSDDHAAAALTEAGVLVIDGVALLPGDSSRIGRTASGVLVFLLPGAPAACLWTYELFAGRAIRRLGGLSPALPYPSRTMTTARKIVSEIGMTEVCPVQRLNEGTVTPIASFTEAGLAAATQADGFVVVPEGSEGHAQGAPVSVYFYDEAIPHVPVKGDAKR